MENMIKDLKDRRKIAEMLYEIYILQAIQNNQEFDCRHENEHDNSGGHPNYHNNAHDNTPGKMMKRTLKKDETN